jgi:nicotinamide-nucleotide amidase
MTANNLRQADVPDGADTLVNERGTAPGLRMIIDGKPVYAIPGPPREMRHMMELHVLPDLGSRSGEGRAIVSRTIRTAGVGESRVAERLTPLWDASGVAPAGQTGAQVNMAFLASAGEVKVRLTAAGPTREAALEVITPVERAVVEEMGEAVFGYDDDTLEGVCGRMLRERGQTLATAESLTGGLVGARITEEAGASEWYLGGAVTYALEAKTNLVAVPPVLLQQAGPVSEAVAAAMAEGAREALGASVGLATTGVAGPDSHGGKEPGTVCVAVADADGTVAETATAPGDRGQIRLWTTVLALNLLRRRLEGSAKHGLEL